MKHIKIKIITPSLFVASIAALGLLLFVHPPTAEAGPATRANPANSPHAANCNSRQTPQQIDQGPNRGKWYCKNNSQPAAGVGAGGAVTRPIGSGKYACGDGDNKVEVSINIGCKGKGNPIADMLFAFIRFLSAGVGLVIIGSIIVGGIQYTGSRGDPQSTAMAINRIRSSVFALFIFIFGFAFLNYLIPGLVLQ